MKSFPPCFLSGHTVLIPKCNDPETLRHITRYTPIPLFNSDNEVFANVLASRIKPVMCSLVEEHQTRGIHAISIQKNAHIARSVFEGCDENFYQVAMVQRDLQKAFNRVRCLVFCAVLKHVGVRNVITLSVPQITYAR